MKILSQSVSSVIQSCPTLWPYRLQHARPPCPSPTPGVTQTQVHWVSDAIQPSHPLLSPSAATFNLSQHQGLFKWVSSSHQVARLLEFQLQHQSFQWTPSTDLLQDGLAGSLCSPRDSQESSPTPQFKSTNSLAVSFLYSPTLTSNMTTGKTIALTRQTFVGKVMSLLFNMLSRFGHERRQWWPTPVLLPGKSHGQRSLVGCGPWSRNESDTTERLYFHFSLSSTGEGNDNPLHCSCLNNPRDMGAWWAAVSGVSQRWTRLKRLSSSSSRLVITFPSRSKHLLIFRLQLPSAVILEPKKIKSVTVSTSIYHEVMGLDPMILVFWMLSFKPTFSLSSFTFTKRLHSSSSLYSTRVVSSAYLLHWRSVED